MVCRLSTVAPAFLAVILVSCSPSNSPVGRGAWTPKPDPLPLPRQTPLDCLHIDPDGILGYLQLPDQKPVYNIYSIAIQALSGYGDISVSRKCRLSLHDVPQFSADLSSQSSLEPRDSLLRSRSIALKWLISKAVSLPNENAFLWYYEFLNSYNDVSTRGLSRWPSAFGQAFVLRAFNKAYQDTRNPKYKQYALRAANAFQIPLAKGGFMVPVGHDAWFYEEMPVTPVPFILNGHLVATIALLETFKLYSDPTVLAMANRGLKAAKLMLPRYDLGYWSRYDLNPRKSELLFRIRPNLSVGRGHGIPVHSLTLRDLINHTHPITLHVGDSAANPQTGAWRVGGVDWLSTESIDGRTAMIALDNSHQYSQSGPPNGGSSFNTYFVTELPTLRFSGNLDVPRFELLLAYKDTAKGSLSVDLRDIRNPRAPTYVPLKTIRLVGDQKWKTMIVPVHSSDLAWFMGADYQLVHVDLLNQLYALTGDRFYRDYARRWQCYVDHQHDYDSMQLVKYPRCN